MRRLRDDGGMTLIELLVCIAVLFLIVAPLTMVLQFALSTTRAAAQRTTDSSGAQLLSSYLVSDVQSAASVWTPASASPVKCGGANTRLELQSIDATTAMERVVSYVADPPSGGSDATPMLVRRTWTVSGGSCVAVDSTNLVRNLDPASLPAATCTPSCATATTVRLSVTALSKQVHNSSLYAPYTFQLTAARRAA